MIVELQHRTGLPGVGQIALFCTAIISCGLFSFCLNPPSPAPSPLRCGCHGMSIILCSLCPRHSLFSKWDGRRQSSSVLWLENQVHLRLASWAEYQQHVQKRFIMWARIQDHTPLPRRKSLMRPLVMQWSSAEVSVICLTKYFSIPIKDLHMVALLCFLPQLPLKNTLYEHHHPYIKRLILFTAVLVRKCWCAVA